jgi:hypothetical protein
LSITTAAAEFSRAVSARLDGATLRLLPACGPVADRTKCRFAFTGGGERRWKDGGVKKRFEEAFASPERRYSLGNDVKVAGHCYRFGSVMESPTRTSNTGSLLNSLNTSPAIRSLLWTSLRDAAVENTTIS